MPNIGEAWLRPYQKAELVEKNPDYGQIVCHCERVSLGELSDAIHSDIPATTLDALRRRTRAMQGRCQGFNCHASLVLSLRGAAATTRAPGASAGEQSPVKLEVASFSMLRLRGEKSATPLSAVDVLIVGGGPAGLAAALELKQLGINDVIVAEREAEAGGIPRMCGHLGFGLSDLHRVLTGPAYARKYRELVEKAGIRVLGSTTITGWKDGDENGGLSQLDFTSPKVSARSLRAVLLAPVCERPRAARLVPVIARNLHHGPLQRFVYEHECPLENAR
jgi:NADPH-dependent 2,4-dienoyl-CoA reductase/sulfur reductase-like enzyme